MTNKLLPFVWPCLLGLPSGSTNSDAAKWLTWARQYADSIDPTSEITVTPQEFWE